MESMITIQIISIQQTTCTMDKLTKLLIIVFLTTSVFSCSKKPAKIPHYTISKVFKTDTATTVDVRIAGRMKAAQLLLIAQKVKADSAKIQNLAIHFLLPGNSDFTSGDNSYYAGARYLKENEVKPTDTLKDDKGNTLRLKIYGLDSAKAKQLLALTPTETDGKTILGKFIDDYNRTLIIPFKDPTGKSTELYIIEVDSTAKVVSATVPQLKIEDGTQKWLVTKAGDYITIKDSVLTQYSSEGLGLPFNSIKSGI
jgi:hypothetical protein